MKSLLVALMVHLLNTQGNNGALDVPIYVVPVSATIITGNGEVLPLEPKATFGPVERQKWQTIVKIGGGVAVVGELCYRSAYGALKRDVGVMKRSESEEVLMQVGGYHALARMAVQMCNNSIGKLDVFPVRHEELASAERSLREAAYVDDVAFLKTCEGVVCQRDGAARFARETVGAPVEAEK